MGKVFKRLIIGILCVALIIGFVPSFNVPSIAESEQIHLIQKNFDDAKDGESNKGIHYIKNWNAYILDAGSYILDENIDIDNTAFIYFYSGNTVLDLNKKILSSYIEVESRDSYPTNVTIMGDGKITKELTSGIGTTVTINGATFEDELSVYNGSLIINSAVVNSNNYAINVGGDSIITINGGKFTGSRGGLYISGNPTVSLSGGTFTATGESSIYSLNKIDNFVSGIVIYDNESNASDSETRFKNMLASGCEYSPSSIKFLSTDYYLYTDQATITVKNNNVTPDNKEVTPEENNNNTNNNNNNNKKNYKNEWIDHQWYDSNGNATYKYKGYWKCNEKGWWFEDEKGWYPQDQWQKIDGDWYFFDDTGYMAENEYAGSWGYYVEGNWWVGSDGRWDGSEPGVWRLSTNGKWWFKDSTGWYAKSKWYKIRGTWYYFDDEGWWDESKTE